VELLLLLLLAGRQWFRNHSVSGDQEKAQPRPSRCAGRGAKPAESRLSGEAWKRWKQRGRWVAMTPLVAKLVEEDAIP